MEVQLTLTEKKAEALEEAIRIAMRKIEEEYVKPGDLYGTLAKLHEELVEVCFWWRD